jgi:signal peptidase II
MKWVFPFLLFLDFISKIGALYWIPPLSWVYYPFGGIPVFNIYGISFSLNTIFNTGAAWGLFSGNPGLLFAFRIVILIVLGLYLYLFQRPIMQRASLWLVATGAVGNAIDYLLYGHVVDFLHFTFWGYSFPIFNLADTYITLGVIGLLLMPRPKSLPVI